EALAAASAFVFDSAIGTTAATHMTVLALETSCDETAVAILRGRDDHSGYELLASEVASQVAAHEKYGGIVPEIASRNHLIYAPRLLDRAASAAKIAPSEIDVFAATSGPGLASSLMIGASIAKGLAIGLCKPYLGVNHLEGHLLSPFFNIEKGGGNDIKPHLSLIVSGGHTMLVLVRGLANYQLIGRTVDDAAGEAFDKVAKMLGLGYPGGPKIEKHARGGAEIPCESRHCQRRCQLQSGITQPIARSLQAERNRIQERRAVAVHGQRCHDRFRSVVAVSGRISFATDRGD